MYVCGMRHRKRPQIFSCLDSVRRAFAGLGAGRAGKRKNQSGPPTKQAPNNRSGLGRGKKTQPSNFFIRNTYFFLSSSFVKLKKSHTGLWRSFCRTADPALIRCFPGIDCQGNTRTHTNLLPRRRGTLSGRRSAWRPPTGSAWTGTWLPASSGLRNALTSTGLFDATERRWGQFSICNPIERDWKRYSTLIFRHLPFLCNSFCIFFEPKLFKFRQG